MLTILGCKSSPAPAVAPDPAGARDAQVKFVHAYVAARQSKDASRIANLFHPNVRACINDHNRPFFDFVVSQEIRNVPKGGYSKLTITPVAAKSSPLIWAFFPAIRWMRPHAASCRASRVLPDDSTFRGSAGSANAAPLLAGDNFALFSILAAAFTSACSA